MIIRIVRMHFTEEGVEKFLEVFNRNKEAIRNFEGCTHLHLLRDIDDKNTFTTFSHWYDVESLNQYRKSALFGKVWAQVKTLFSKRSVAFSVEKFIEV